MSVDTVDDDAMLEFFKSPFYIGRNSDTDIVVYNAVVSGNTLVSFNPFWSKRDDWSSRDDVSERTKELLYGVTFKRLEKRVYRVQLNILKGSKISHLIDIHIKKSGKIVAKIALKDSNGKLKECTLKKISANVETFPIPTVKELWIHGTFKGEEIKQEVDVSELTSKFSITDFVPMF